jgi:hypothetical protein
MVGVLIGTQNDVTAASAIASIRSTLRDKFFPAKAYASAPAIACLGKNPDPVYEHARLYCALALFRPCPSFDRDKISDFSR